PNGEAKNPGMSGELADLPGDAPDDVVGPPAVLQEGDVLLPGQPGHDAQAAGGGQVEQPERGRGVSPHAVKAGFAHRREVLLDDLPRGELQPVLVRAKRAVGDALDVELTVTYEEKLPFGSSALGKGSRTRGGGPSDRLAQRCRRHNAA